MHRAWGVLTGVTLLGVLTGVPATTDPIAAEPVVHVDQPLTVAVEPGILTITASDHTVDLGELVVDTANGRLVSTRPTSLAPITVTDTRPGHPGYDVTASVSDFVSGANRINAANLGWNPRIVDAPTLVNIAPGPDVPPGDGLPPGQTGTVGLGVPRVLARSSYDEATGHGPLGTVVLTAALQLRAPTATPAGVYVATMVITVA